MALSLFSPFIKRRDMDAVLTTLVADQLVPGSQVEELIAVLKTMFSCESGKALREYPRAIELALASLELPPHSRVAISALAPRSWFRALQAAGHEAVIVDVHPHNPTINAATVATIHAEAALGAVVAVHSLGYLADMDALLNLEIPLIEDIGQSFGHSTGETGLAGSRGDLVLCSLENDGIVTAGGGALVFARSRKDAQNLQKHAELFDAGVWMTDLNAALGKAQVSEYQVFLDRRREMAGLLSRAILRGHHKMLVPLSEGESPAATMAVLINASVSDVLAYARKKNIEAALAFQDSILHTWTDEDDPRRFPQAYGLLLRCVLFPLHPGIRAKELEGLERVLATLP